MSKILKAAEHASSLMTNFSQLLATADVTKAQSLPLMTATSLILVGTENTQPGVLLASGFNSVRESLKSRFAALEALTKTS